MLLRINRCRRLMLVIGCFLNLHAGLLFGYSLDRDNTNKGSSEITAIKTFSKASEYDTSNLILKILNSNFNFFKNYIDSSEAFEIQIIYTQIDRNKRNRPHFKSYSYRLNNKEYFCPASTSKLPVLLCALEKLNQLKIKGIDKYTAMRFDSAWMCQEKALKDTVAPDSILNIAHYIEKILLVSDNDAHNRLFEFLGQQAINKRLWDMGFKQACIIQQFNNCDADCNRYTNPMLFVNSSGKVLYSQPLVMNPDTYKNPLGAILKGKGYINDDGQLVEQPRDFTFYNNLPLQDLHDIMLRVIFPDNFSKKQRFNLKPEDYSFIYKYMCMLPRESDFLKYHDTVYCHDNRKKYLMYGTDAYRNIVDNNIRIFNIVGQLSGYLTDCAYIADFKNNVEFILAATIYNNQSGIFDISNYRYKTIGLPFLQELGRSVYNYELLRPKKYKPDFRNLIKCVEEPVK